MQPSAGDKPDRMQSKEYVDSCIGKFNILPKTIMQTEIDEITKKLEPYNVTISILGFLLKKLMQ